MVASSLRKPLQVRTDHLVEPIGQRILGADSRQHVLHDPAVDPGQQGLGLAIDQGLHQHQRGAQEQGQQRAVEGDLEGRSHAGQVVQEGIEVLDQRQDLADVHQSLGDAFNRADEADHRQEVKDVSRQREPAGHVLLIEPRSLAVDLHELGGRRGVHLADVADELADSHVENPPVAGEPRGQG